MKLRYLIDGLVLICITASCQNEAIIEKSSTEEKYYSLEINKSEGSRTTLDGKTTLWSKGDQVYVTSKDGKVYGTLTLKGNGGENSGRFEGFVVGGEPSNLQHIVFPAPKDGKTIDMSARTPGKLDAPMIGTINPSGAVQTLNNVGGLLAIPVSNVMTSGETLSVEVTSGTDNMTGGYYTFDATAGTLKYTPVANKTASVTVPATGNLVYVPVATTTDATDGVYEGEEVKPEVNVAVTVKNEENEVISGGSVSIKNGDITGDSADEQTVSTLKLVDTPEKLQTAVAAGGYVKLTQDIESSEAIIISSNVVLDGNGKILKSTKVGESGRAINVGQSGKGDLNVTIKDLTINASGQRGINIIQGSHNVTLENVTATATNYAVNVAGSAPNSKVTINESELTGLNVVNIAAIGTTMEINNTILTCNDKNENENYGAIAIDPINGSNSTVTVNGGVINVEGVSVAGKHPGSSNIFINGTTGNNEIKVLVCYIDYGDNYNYSFATLEEAFKIVKDNETITLCGDITVTKPISHDGIINIDRNGYTIIGVENITLTNGNIINSKDNN